MDTIKPSALSGLIGQETGVSDWIEVGQDRINQFADCTEDHQFIHVNPDMAKMTPFGTTIAHGFLSLSLLAGVGGQAMAPLEGVKMGVNYGLNKVRFLAPVKVDSRVRARFVLKEYVEKAPGQHLVTYECTVEIEGEDKPALVAEWINMFFT